MWWLLVGAAAWALLSVLVALTLGRVLHERDAHPF